MKVKLITLILLLIMLIVPALADDNPFDNINMNATQEVPVTNATHINLTQPDISGHYDYVDISGNTLTSHFGRLVFSSTPYIVRHGVVTNSVAQISAQDQLKTDQKISGNELTTSYSSGDSIKNRFYRSLIKENITLNSQAQEIGYKYQDYLTDWTIKEPYFQFNNTTGINETVYHNVTCYANNSNVSVDLDKWGNAVIFINGANTLVVPVPTAVDAAGNTYLLSWDIDKEGKKLHIGNLAKLQNAIYPITIDLTNVLQNYGFESGSLTPWVSGGSYTPGFYIISGGHNGNFSAGINYWTGGFDYYQYTATATLSQPINAYSTSNMSCYYEFFMGSMYGTDPSMSLFCGNNSTYQVAYGGLSSNWQQLGGRLSGNANNFGVSFSVTSTYDIIDGWWQLGMKYYVDDCDLEGSNPIVANFTASPTSGSAPLTVNFTDTSSGNPTIWHWDFGDETNSTEENPSHTYYTPGTYNVTLNASNSYGYSWANKTNFITVNFNPLIANFTASPMSGNAPLVVQFTDTSTDFPTSWLWDFGDGSNSTEQNPVHMYSQSGNFTISLTVSNAAGSNTTTNYNYINVTWVPYVYQGIYWHQGYAQYYPHSTIQSSWIPSLDAAANTWSNITNFYFSKNSSSSNYLYYEALGSSGPIATTFWWPPYGDSMSAACITFNADDPFSTSEASGCFDVQTVAVHEFGHWLSLGHSSDSQAVMYPYINRSLVKRNLYWDDTMGIVYIYGSDKSIKNEGSESTTNKSMTISTSSLLEAYTHEDLSNHSNTIVQGTVKEILPSKWNTIDGKQPNKSLTKLIPGVDVIYTDTIIKVDKYLKNPQSSKEVVVRTFGGTVGNVTIKSEDDPIFEPGEKVLFYLSKDTSPHTDNIGLDHFMVTGFLQGKFKLTNDGKASRPDETVSQGALLSTIKK